MLYKKLIEHAQDGPYPFHMPGHKRNPAFMPESLPYGLDITEIPGFDDLHNPTGVLLEIQELACSLYGSRESFLLTTGSTTGILAAIGAHAKHGDKILADSNCHRSIPNAAALFGLELASIASDVDERSGVPCSIKPDAVEDMLRVNPDISLVVITSPSYEGVVSDIAAIARVSHNAGALLLVDCAHGAHLGFPHFPESPVRLGADIVVVSLHKTLPALTQCSLLHLCSERADSAATRRLLSILQTSSPSYVLMASAGHCLSLLQSDGERLFKEYKGNLRDFLQKADGRLPVLGKRPGFFDFDPGKIVIITKNTPLDGFMLSDMLRNEHNIELERACGDYAIAMTSICDPPEAYVLLADALTDIYHHLQG